MAANPFDQFDTATANPFDQFGGGAAVPAVPAVSNEEAIFGKSISNAERKLGLGEQLMSLPLTAATAISSGPAALAGMWGEALGGKATGEKIRNALTFPTYTEAQQRQLEALGGAMEAAHLPPTLGGAGIPLNAMAAPATAQAVNAMGKVVKAPLPFGATMEQQAAAQAARQSAADWARAPKIEAAQAAQRLGLAINPAEANPNVKTKMLVGMAGEPVVEAKLSRANRTRLNEIAREDMGLPENTPLDAKAFEMAREAQSGPYNRIRGMGQLVADQDTLDQINGLKLDPNLIGGAEKVAKVNGMIDDAVNLTSEGIDGKQAIDNIRQLRNDASRTMRNQNASPVDLDVADAKINIANALENLIERNIQDPKALDEFRAARTAMAKTYDWERATGITTKQVDPAEIVKMAEKGKKLSGALKDVAIIAGNYPGSVSLTEEPLKQGFQYLKRGGYGATVGGVVGGLPGAAIGAGIGAGLSESTANMLARPSVQNKLAIPKDRRIPLKVELRGMANKD